MEFNCAEDFIEAEMFGKKYRFKTGHLAGVEMGIIQLRHYKEIGCSPIPKELDWEIRLYEWILAQPDKEAMAALYAAERGKGFTKRQAVANLGWVIS